MLCNVPTAQPTVATTVKVTVLPADTGVVKVPVAPRTCPAVVSPSPAPAPSTANEVTVSPAGIVSEKVRPFRGALALLLVTAIV